MSTGRWLARLWLVLGYFFLYAPILVLIVYSFNNSGQDMKWMGLTWHWYRALVHDTELIGGLYLSLKVACLSSSCSVLLGTLIAFVLNRYRCFYGRALFRGLASAPLIMPDVVIGLSLLFLLVGLENSLGFTQRGLITLIFGHTVVGVAYAAVVVESRLQQMNPALADAAMDLGCRPFQVFLLVTLPTISQALISAWLLAFTLSLDDVVIASFLTGPGYSTMPIIIFSRARLGLDPRVNALATVIIAILSLVLITWSVFMGASRKCAPQPGLDLSGPSNSSNT